MVNPSKEVVALNVFQSNAISGAVIEPLFEVDCNLFFWLKNGENISNEKPVSSPPPTPSLPLSCAVNLNELIDVLLASIFCK